MPTFPKHLDTFNPKQCFQRWKNFVTYNLGSICQFH